jgi:hypothetical protein
MISFKNTFTLVVILFFATAAYSQATLNLCTYVSNDGYCAFDNNKFITTPDTATGKIFMKISSSQPLGVKLIYKIFNVTATGEEFDTTFEQSLGADWLYAWMPYNFLTNRKYNIKIYNNSNDLICSKTFELVAGKN